MVSVPSPHMHTWHAECLGRIHAATAWPVGYLPSTPANRPPASTWVVPAPNPTLPSKKTFPVSVIVTSQPTASSPGNYS